ncbi:uncharacterized protein LOC134836649 [Culicoides brevitarsis]|uniref:uncharacterized protein LOC134836649 n=1 Tax=Culicoides brevitarsis TaxID=469753 RepID=UPI00307C9046
MSTCAYKDCYAVRTPCCQITFFNLPIAPERRKIWIENAGPNNPKLQNLDEKAKRIFCEAHFEEKYMRRQFNRTTLHPTAVPIKYGSTEPGNEEMLTEDESEETNQNFVLIEKFDENEANITIEGPEDANKSQEETILGPYDDPETRKSPVLPRKSIKRGLDEANSEPETSNRLKLKKVKLVGGQFLLPKLHLIPEKFTEEPPIEEESAVSPLKSTSSSQTDQKTTELVDKSVQVSPEEVLYCEEATQTDPVPEEKVTKVPETEATSSKIEDEDVYFLVKVIGEAMKRLPPEKKGEAKLHMISYMFNLEHNINK